MTWRPPCRFGGRLAISTVGAAALVIGLAVPAAGPTLEVAAPVGSLSTSMVEMLDDEGYGSTMTLDELRDDVLGGYFDGSDGTGIDVAVIDTGVAPVSGLDGDKVLHGPDLSFEGQTPEVAYLDTYGHGTHMAAIIAGDRPGQEGIAPGARIVSVKVAGHDGITTVPQVVAAIDWVVEHRNTDGLNIRVLNLSLGQSGVASHVGDHLSAAVERAWEAGIFVVIAAGNDGSNQFHLDSPAIDPYVMAVGAADVNGDEPEDFDVPSWSGRGNGDRNPSVVAPGLSIASYRVPGSTIDIAGPSARYGDNLFKGTGTSQAAAATSGLAAVLLAEHPNLTPDQVKDTISYYADSIERGRTRDGEGLIDNDTTDRSPITSGTPQNHVKAAGPGSGLITPNGSTWSGGTWSGGTWSGATWSGATWSGGTWSGATWSGATWSGATWSGATWSGGTWSGATWSGATWSGATWSGATWSANGWS
ncbi:MAG: S8 family serine peptidase [Acidimicrobiia bacterium]|nr:S8 family serine peptidase [Acidimicrobiia bacterium]